jgi:hypothetical protein
MYPTYIICLSSVLYGGIKESSASGCLSNIIFTVPEKHVFRRGRISIASVPRFDLLFNKTHPYDGLYTMDFSEN